MLTIILIFLISIMVYRNGVISKILEQLRIYDNPTPIEEIEPISVPVSRSWHYTTDREELEREAAWIVEKQGHNPYTVKYMGDSLLIGVIRDYWKAVENSTDEDN